MNRRKLWPILVCALLLPIAVPVAFWLWPVPLPPIEAEQVAEITYPYGTSGHYRITDRQQIDQLVESFNKVTLRRYLPGYQSKLPTSDIVFWNSEGRELRRLTVYHVVAGYQVIHNAEPLDPDYRFDPKGIRVLVTDDFLWQVRNGGLDFFFEELELLSRDAIY